jgi:hypothetical protein
MLLASLCFFILPDFISLSLVIFISFKNAVLGSTNFFFFFEAALALNIALTRVFANSPSLKPKCH